MTQFPVKQMEFESLHDLDPYTSSAQAAQLDDFFN